jgi:hypothetical protein
MEWGPAVAALFTALLPLIQWWLSKAPERAKATLDAKVQTARKSIADGDSTTVTVLIDSVPQSSNSTPRLGNDEDTKGRLERLGIK